MVVKMWSMATTAAVVISGFAAAQSLAASTCTGTVIEYQASGGFGANPIAGSDKYKLHGEPFSITIYICESLQPRKIGGDYAEYYPIEMKGQVQSALFTTPFDISASTAFILIKPATGPDSIEVEGTVTIEGTEIPIKGDIAVPAGTLTSTSIAPFSRVAITTAHSAFTYSAGPWQASHAFAVGQEIVDPLGNAQLVTTAGTTGATAPAWNETVNGTTTDGTVLWTDVGNGASPPGPGPYIATELSVIGNASATVYTPSDKADVLLHTGAVQVITAQADGTHSVRPLQAGPVEPGASTGKTMLQFYASGVRDASEVHVEIGGQDVPVLYSGAAGHFPGLDEVTVEVPRNLAGMGDVDVVMTVDGQAASPVRIRIQ
jgi:uncharacterized protein (TIGR03437 family)